jgi:hypothetical protein
MSYSFSPESANMTYSEFLLAIRNLSNIIESRGGEIAEFTKLMRFIQGWDVFYNPKIVIYEVNNKSIGHIYLGKIRVPVSFSKLIGGGLKAIKLDLCDI